MNASASSLSRTIAPRNRSSSEISGTVSVDTPTARKWRWSGRMSEPISAFSPVPAGATPGHHGVLEHSPKVPGRKCHPTGWSHRPYRSPTRKVVYAGRTTLCKWRARFMVVISISWKSARRVRRTLARAWTTTASSRGWPAPHANCGKPADSSSSTSPHAPASQRTPCTDSRDGQDGAATPT
jgi:hypothetical protein